MALDLNGFLDLKDYGALSENKKRCYLSYVCKIGLTQDDKHEAAYSHMMEILKKYPDDNKLLYYNFTEDYNIINSNNIGITYISGGRGTGKTFNALLLMYKYGLHFIYLKRTKEDVKALIDAKELKGGNPFISINEKIGSDVQLEKAGKDMGVFKDYTNDENGELIGAIFALSDIGKLRSFDFTYYDIILLDEAIPDELIIERKGQGRALLNLQETINRNRTADGKKNVPVILMANSNRLDSVILKETGLLRLVEKVENSGQYRYVDSKRSVMVVNITYPPISLIKSMDPVYRYSKGTPFYDMAIYNKFAIDDMSQIKYYRIKSFKPVLGITTGFNTYYLWKNKDGVLYWSYCRHNKNIYNINNKHERTRYLWSITELDSYYVLGKMYFESYEIKLAYLDSKKAR